MSQTRICILVIDDDPDLTAAVRVTLEPEGYEVIEANSGRAGLEIAYLRHPHLILLDINMPGMDGYQVCRELQFGYTKDIPIVFLTSCSELEDMQRASRAGASGYITKPFRPDRLLAAVRDLLRDALVFYDDITGLPTLAQVQVELQRRLFDHSQLGMLYVTIEGVWALEQTQGFEVVDDVFRLVGHRLNLARGRLLREDDFVLVSSLGNAFLVVLGPPRRGGGVASDHLVRVKRRLEHHLVKALEQELHASLYTKIALYVGFAKLTQSPKVRFRRALVEAIESAARSIERERSGLQHRLQQDFERVLLDRQIRCVYQPIVQLEAYDVLGYELLCRGPLGSELFQPDALFEVARHEGCVADLDRVCRLAATSASSLLPRKYLRFINIEPVSLFFHAQSQEFVREFIDATPEELRRRTVIEITENAIIEDFERMRGTVRTLREEGFKIAIDDAGAGYSGLLTMVELESDFIKLDMSLTRNIEDSQVKQRLVKTLRDFCADANIELVAEGVETRAQLDVLKALGVVYGQGFLFAHPGVPFPLQDTIGPRDDAQRVPAAGTHSCLN